GANTLAPRNAGTKIQRRPRTCVVSRGSSLFSDGTDIDVVVLRGRSNTDICLGDSFTIRRSFRQVALPPSCLQPLFMVRCNSSSLPPVREVTLMRQPFSRSHSNEHHSQTFNNALLPPASDLIRVGSRRWFLQTGLAGLAGVSLLDTL